MSGHAQAKANVFFDRHMRVECIGLKNHGHATIRRTNSGHIMIANLQFPRRDLLQPGNHAQQGRLAAAGGAYKNTEFPIGDIKVNAFDDADLAKLLFHIVECDIGHGLFLHRFDFEENC